MGKKSRDKGGRGQRAVAKLLKKWWGSDFASTPMSGGFATKKFRDEWNAAADIVTPDDTFPFSVEVKWHEGWVLDELLTSEKTKIWKWWEQCVDEAPEGMIPLLVFKRNRQPWLFMMWESHMPDRPISRVFYIEVPKEFRRGEEKWITVGQMDDLMVEQVKEIYKNAHK